MAKQLPTITLLFAGGATLHTEGEGVLTVQKPEDVKPWMEHVPELSLIAKVEPVFVLPDDGKEIEPEDWNKFITIISDRYEKSDGFVILQGMDTMLYSSAFISFSLQGQGKPVVLTGAPLTPEFASPEELQGFISHYHTLGVRANLINSIQVSTLAIAETCILFGNQLLRANRARKAPGTTFNVFEADEPDTLGRVDFGIKLKVVQLRTAAPIHAVLLAEKNLAVVRLHPGYRPEELKQVVQSKPDGLLVHTYMQSGLPEKLYPILRLAEQQGIPMAIFNPYLKPSVPFNSIACVHGISYEALYTKFLWALSKTTNPGVIKKLLEQNIAKEFGGGKVTGN